MQRTAPLVAEINLAAIRHNLFLVREAVGPGVRICPAVKANAYGHGIATILPTIRASGVEDLAVATLDEALELRELGWTGRALVFGRPVLGATAAEIRMLAREVVRADLTCSIAGEAEAGALADAARETGRRARVQVKIDSGMGRAGLEPAQAIALVHACRRVSGLFVEAVYTHFATADESDLTFANEQLATFTAATAGLDVPMRHAANTAAIFRLPDSHFQLVRPGIGMYGYWPDPTLTAPVALRPSLRLVSRLTAVRRLPTGHAVGYGRAFVASRDTVIGLVPIGYADGYRRSLGNRAVMTVEPRPGRPQIAPVIGRISMDQTVLDLTDVPGVGEGDRVVIIDDAPAAPNSVSALARLMDTIPYEVTCGLGHRVQPRGHYSLLPNGV